MYGDDGMSVGVGDGPNDGTGTGETDEDETSRKSKEHTAAGSKNREILLLLFRLRAKLLFRDILLAEIDSTLTAIDRSMWIQERVGGSV